MAMYVGSAGAQTPGASLRSPSPVVTAPTTLLVPSNWRSKGANLTFNFSDGSGSLGAEGGSWVNFSTNYTTWWQPQIDDAAAIGINCLRIWGSPQPVCDSYITLSTYLSRWETVLDYCNTKGIKVYPCGGDLDRWTTASDSATVSLYGSWSSMLATHANVIGVDLTNEVWAKCDPINPGGRSQSSALTLLGQLKDAVNAHGLPATNSQGITYQGGGWTLDTWNGVSKAPFYAMSDFIDYHLYWPWPYQRPSGSPNGDYMSDIYTSSTLGPAVTGKQVIFGEFGCLPTDTDRATLYPGIKDLINASTNHLGGCAWSCWDYSTDSAWKWGLYSTSGFPTGPFTRSLRTDISTQFASYPTTR